MAGARLLTAAIIVLACAAAPRANLLDGYYQITGLTYIQDDDGRQRSFSGTGLYIFASGKSVKLAGALRGYPLSRNLVVDTTIGDTLVLREAANLSNTYKFRIRNNTVSGRHRIGFDDGSSHIIDAAATIRKLNQGEADRLRETLTF